MSKFSFGHDVFQTHNDSPITINRYVQPVLKAELLSCNVPVTKKKGETGGLLLPDIKANTTRILSPLRTMLVNSTNASLCCTTAGSVNVPCVDCVPGTFSQHRNLLDRSYVHGAFNTSSRDATLDTIFTNVSLSASTSQCGNACVQSYQTDKLTSAIAPTFLFYIIGSIMLVVFLLGFSENAIVIYVYIRNRKLQTVSNVFIVGLSISDIGQAIFNLPLVVIANFSEGWIFGDDVCMYYGFVTTTFGLSQISLLTVIAMERYCIIVHHTRVFSSCMNKAMMAIGFCFTYGCAWALGPLFGWSEYKVEKFGTRCAVSWEIKNMTYLSYTLCLFTFVWFIPLLLITFGYTSIACMIYREKSMKSTIRKSSQRKSTKERKVAITVLIMIGAFIISWLPYSAVALYTAIAGTSNLSFAATLVPALIAKSSIIWNPIIYVVRHRDFRRACVKTLQLCLLCNQHQHNDHLVKTDCPKWGSNSQENMETSQRLLKQASMSISEGTSSHESCAGTRISGLICDSFDTVGRDKIPKLTCKDSWKYSPHPIVRRNFEEKRIIIPSLDPDASVLSPSVRSKERSASPFLRKTLLRTVSASKVLATVVDIECESGQGNMNSSGTESMAAVGPDHSREPSTSTRRYQPSSPLLKIQPRQVKVRRHVSMGEAVQKGSFVSGTGYRGYGAGCHRRVQNEGTMFDTRCDEIVLPYRRKPRLKMTGGRRHLSDSSTTVNKESRYNKYDAKQKRCMMRTKGVQQKIEMSVFDRESSSVFNVDDLHGQLGGLGFQTSENDGTNGGMQGLRLLSTEDDDQEIFESHIGACSMIRQSTV